MKPGVYYGMSFAAYREIDALNQSTLKAFAKNPEAYMDGLPEKSGDSFRWGSLFELLLLGEDEAWRDEYVVLTDAIKDALLAEAQVRQGAKASSKFNKNLLEHKRWVAEQSDQGRMIIDEVELRSCEIAVARTRREPNIKSLFSLGGEAQVAIVWEDPDTGLLCKGLIDWAPNEIASLVDIKTSKELLDVSAEGAQWKFARAVRNLGYDVQAAMYCDGWNLAREQSGVDPDPRPGWLFVVSGNSKPWSAAGYSLSQETIDQGASKYKHALHLWKSCHESGHFPGLTTEEQWPELPTLKELS